MRALSGIWTPWMRTGTEVLAGLESRLDGARRPWAVLAGVLLATLAAWWVYVPLHELLHALGCVATGGRVEELQIGRLYGGGLLESVFPFVKAGGEYAGRLSGFDTGGSDMVYLATDVAPYLLTIFGAFPLLRLARRSSSVVLLGTAIVLLAAPAISLGGDYYEIGSILVSGGIGRMPGAAGVAAWSAMRHDDLPALLGEFEVRFSADRLVWGTAVAAAALLGFLLAGVTLAASRGWADLLGLRTGGATVDSKAPPGSAST